MKRVTLILLLALALPLVAQDKDKDKPQPKPDSPAPQLTAEQKYQVRELELRQVSLQNQFMQLQQQATQLGQQQDAVNKQLEAMVKGLCPETGGKPYRLEDKDLNCVPAPQPKQMAPDKLPPAAEKK